MPLEIFTLIFVLGAALTRVFRQRVPALSKREFVAVGPRDAGSHRPDEHASLGKPLALELLLFASAAVPVGLQSSKILWADFPPLFSPWLTASLALTYGGLFLLRNPRVLRPASPTHQFLTTIARLCCALLCLSVGYAVVIDAFTILRFAF